MSERAGIEERMAGTGIPWSSDCGVCGQVPAWVATHESYWKDKGGHVRTMKSTGPLCAEHHQLAAEREGRAARIRCEHAPTPPADTIGYDCCLVCPEPRVMREGGVRR